jgi:hypothetical protein
MLKTCLMTGPHLKQRSRTAGAFKIMKALLSSAWVWAATGEEILRGQLYLGVDVASLFSENVVIFPQKKKTKYI